MAKHRLLSRVEKLEAEAKPKSFIDVIFLVGVPDTSILYAGFEASYGDRVQVFCGSSKESDMQLAAEWARRIDSDRAVRLVCISILE